jgi:hypothetical protein
LIVISYCTYSDFLYGNVPFDTVALVDEVDSLFFADAPVMSGARLLSAIILLNKYRVIGMTATFRGQKGMDKLTALLKDSVVLTAGVAAPERILTLEVYGKLKP